MGKISPVSAKYITHATIAISGVVDRPDVIGAIFGQTEGLLGSELELRELQRSGRIGRIEVNVETAGGKTTGTIDIPSSLDKAETSIVGAALEVIDRIGPCEAKIKVTLIEDVRVSKREYVIERAKELLRELMDKTLPDSQEISDEVAQSVRVMELTTWGRERLPAGPTIEDSEDIIVVEGRADVINLLKHGFKNVISLNGTNVPEAIKALSREKVVTAFVDGDRGGDLIIKELIGTSELDYISKAPDGKEVEEITKKEIHKALRSRVNLEQYKLEHGIPKETAVSSPESGDKGPQSGEIKSLKVEEPVSEEKAKKKVIVKKKEEKVEIPLTDEEKTSLSDMADELIGSRGAYLLDEKLNVLGKVPLSELETNLKDMANKVYAVIMDSSVDEAICAVAKEANVKCLIGKELNVDPVKVGISVMVGDDL